MTKILLDLNYSLMSYLREVLRKEKYRIWTDNYACWVKENISIEELAEEKQKVMDETRNIWLPQGRCNLILDQIDNYEEMFQNYLKTKGANNYHCPKCDKDIIITDQERPQGILYLPRWRKLDCNHYIDPFGKIMAPPRRDIVIFPRRNKK